MLSAAHINVLLPDLDLSRVAPPAAPPLGARHRRGAWDPPRRFVATAAGPADHRGRAGLPLPYQADSFPLSPGLTPAGRDAQLLQGIRLEAERRGGTSCRSTYSLHWPSRSRLRPLSRRPNRR